jgi:hypothetical protein
MIETASYAINSGSVTVFATILLLSVVVTLIVCGLISVLRASDSKTISRLFVLLFVLGLLGGVAGYAGGLSREAAVGTIIPAILGIAGGLSAYLFGVDGSRGAVASISLAVFTTLLFFGFVFGSSVRSESDLNAQFREACFKLFYDPQTYASEETVSLAKGEKNVRYNNCIEYWTHL